MFKFLDTFSSSTFGLDLFYIHPILYPGICIHFAEWSYLSATTHPLLFPSATLSILMRERLLKTFFSMHPFCADSCSCRILSTWWLPNISIHTNFHRNIFSIHYDPSFRHPSTFFIAFLLWTFKLFVNWTHFNPLIIVLSFTLVCSSANWEGETLSPHRAFSCDFIDQN